MAIFCNYISVLTKKNVIVKQEKSKKLCFNDYYRNILIFQAFLYFSDKDRNRKIALAKWNKKNKTGKIKKDKK